MTVSRNLSLLSPNLTTSGTVNNAGLTNSSITINGTPVSLGGTTTIPSGSGTVTSVGGTGTVSGLTLSGTVTSAGSLTLGGTLSVTPSNFTSQSANTVLVAPNGTAGTPTFRSLVAADIPTLNQNTTGTAANVTGTVAITNGGTGQTTRQAALNALAGSTTAGQYLRGNSSAILMSAIQATDVPILNQNTTGTAANVTGTVAVTNGGTGQTSFTDGQLLIGSNSTFGLTKATLTAGANITITNGPGSIIIAATSSGGGGSSSPAAPLAAGVVFGRTDPINPCSPHNSGRVSLGYNAGGIDSGCYCVQQNAGAVAIGRNAGVAGGAIQSGYSIAIGACTTAPGMEGIAIGSGANAGCCAIYGIAIGSNSMSVGYKGIAIGQAAQAYGCSVAIGGSGYSNNSNQTVVGACASAGGTGTIAIGSGTYAAGCAPNRTFMGPIRNATGPFTLKYNPSTREITYE